MKRLNLILCYPALCLIAASALGADPASYMPKNLPRPEGIEKFIEESIRTIDGERPVRICASAANAGRWDIVEYYLNRGFQYTENISYRDKYNTIMNLAVGAGQLEIAKKFIENCPVAINSNEPFLMALFSSGSVDTLSFFWEEYFPNITFKHLFVDNCKSNLNVKYLVAAIGSGNKSFVEFILQREGLTLDDLFVCSDYGIGKSQSQKALTTNPKVPQGLSAPSKDQLEQLKTSKQRQKRLNYLLNLACASKTNTELAAYFIEKGAKINRPLDMFDFDGSDSPFEIAWEGKNLVMLKFLLSQKEKVEIPQNLIEQAVVHNDLQQQRLLLEIGVSPDIEIKLIGFNSKAPEYPWLIAALICRNYQIANLLLDHGTNVNIKDKEGNNSYLWLAMRQPNPFKSEESVAEYESVKKRLLEKGLNLNNVNNHGMSLFLSFASLGKVDELRFLAGQGVKVDETVKPLFPKNKNEHGGTALHLAIASGNLDAIKYLVEELKMDVNAKTENGKTVLEMIPWYLEDRFMETDDILLRINKTRITQSLRDNEKAIREYLESKGAK